MKLTDILLTVFDKNKPPLTDQDITKNIFIINQYISIKYPIQVAQFNNMKISPKAQYYYWRDRFGKMKKIPPSFWVKVNKSKAATKINKNSLAFITKIYNLDRKDIISLSKREEFIEELKQIEETLK